MIRLVCMDPRPVGGRFVHPRASWPVRKAGLRGSAIAFEWVRRQR